MLKYVKEAFQSAKGVHPWSDIGIYSSFPHDWPLYSNQAKTRYSRIIRLTRTGRSVIQTNGYYQSQTVSEVTIITQADRLPHKPQTVRSSTKFQYRTVEFLSRFKFYPADHPPPRAGPSAVHG
jgi:hypothetical protein